MRAPPTHTRTQPCRSSCRSAVYRPRTRRARCAGRGGEQKKDVPQGCAVGEMTPLMPASAQASWRGRSRVVVEVVVVAEDHVVRVVAVIVGEGALCAQVGEAGGHRRVLVLERELALLGVGENHGRDDEAAVGRDRLGRRALDLAVDRLAHRLHPLLDLDLGDLVLRHVAHHGELLRAGGEDHLAHRARAPLAVLRLRVRLGVHRVHAGLEQL
mmetsp:Transcript_8412/g.14205  ORF Transcript_8412/g.14205 Transcript_8412/m.14205 type:complete len:213 (-) Transcript_8412:655-1293(-)